MKKYCNTRQVEDSGDWEKKKQALNKDKKYHNEKKQLHIHRFNLYLSLQKLLAAREKNCLQPLATSLRNCFQYFKAGYEMLKPLEEKIIDLENNLKTINKELNNKRRKVVEMSKDFKACIEKQMREGREISTAGNIRDLEPGGNHDTSTMTKEGYLFLRQSHSCSYIWATVKDGLITVQPAGINEVGMTQSIPLLLCTVKCSDFNRLRFLFEVVSPGNSFLLQADSDNARDAWMDVIQNCIRHQLNDQVAPSSSKKKSNGGNNAGSNETKKNLQAKMLWAIPGNKECVDCSSKDPDWLSMNLGSLLCVKCSGHHRNLGVHLSQVRSLTMDRLDPYRLEYMKAVGNKKANAIWEASLNENSSPGRIDANADQKERNAFIRAKYVDKKFLAKDKEKLSEDQINRSMFVAINNNDLMSMLKSVFWGGDINWKNSDEDQRTAFLQAVHMGSTLLVQALMLNGTNVTQETDMRLWNALHYCAFNNDSTIANLLVTKGSSELLFKEDVDGRRPLDLALHEKEISNRDQSVNIPASEINIEEGERAENSSEEQDDSKKSQNDQQIQDIGENISSKETNNQEEEQNVTGEQQNEDEPPPPPPPPPESSTNDEIPGSPPIPPPHPPPRPPPQPPAQDDELPPPPPPPQDICDFFMETTQLEEAKLRARIKKDMEDELEVVDSDDDDLHVATEPSHATSSPSARPSTSFLSFGTSQSLPGSGSFSTPSGKKSGLLDTSFGKDKKGRRSFSRDNKEKLRSSGSERKRSPRRSYAPSLTTSSSTGSFDERSRKTTVLGSLASKNIPKSIKIGKMWKSPRSGTKHSGHFSTSSVGDWTPPPLTRKDSKYAPPRKRDLSNFGKFS